MTLIFWVSKEHLLGTFSTVTAWNGNIAFLTQNTRAGWVSNAWAYTPVWPLSTSLSVVQFEMEDFYSIKSYDTFSHQGRVYLLDLIPKGITNVPKGSGPLMAASPK